MIERIKLCVGMAVHTQSPPQTTSHSSIRTISRINKYVSLKVIYDEIDRCQVEHHPHIAIHNWLFKTKPLPICMHITILSDGSTSSQTMRSACAIESMMLRASTRTSSSIIYGQSSNYLGSLNTHKLYGYTNKWLMIDTQSQHSTNQRKSYGWMSSAGDA